MSVVVLAGAIGLLLAASAAAATTRSGTLADQLESIRRAKMASVDAGFVVRDLATGQTLWSHGGGTPLMPASNQKLVTTAAALHLLGPDAELETSVHERGVLGRDGTLAGDLIVKGGGDPNLSGRFFDGDITYVLRELARGVARRGIRKVTGSLVLDATFFDSVFVHPGWPKDQLDSWYSAPVSGLGLNDNCVDVIVAPGAVGGAAAVRTDPEGWLHIESQATTRAAGKGDPNQLGIARLPDNRIKVTGWVRAGRPEYRGYVTVEEPVRYFGVLFRRALEAEGIQVAGLTQAPAPIDVAGLPCLAVSRSRLTTVVEVANTVSQNLYAECLIKLMGARIEGEGSWPAGARAIGRYLGSLGSATQGFVIDDGSGLSRGNRVTAAGLVALLGDTWSGALGESFLASLPRSGASTGSLRSRMKEPGMKGRIAAKTGHIRDVNALSGYVLDKQGRPRLAFAMLANGFLGRRVSSPTVGATFDDLCRALVRYADSR